MAPAATPGSPVRWPDTVLSAGMTPGGREGRRRVTEPVVGIVMGSDSTGRSMEPAAAGARGVRRPIRGARALGPPDAAPDARLRRGGRRTWAARDHRRRRGSGPPARDGRGGHPAAGHRRPSALDRLDGMDSLLSIVQMPAGVPVATVGIGGGRNAGLLAVRILAASDDKLRAAVAASRRTWPIGGRPGRHPPGAPRRARPSARGLSIVPVGNNTGLYALSEEHEAIREAVRDIAEREIAPYAAEVDAEPRYPVEAQKALTAAGFHATHIPEAYGGEGADAIATCIVIEEVARVDCSSSLIPAVNKLGSMPIILSGAEDVKQKVLPSSRPARR